MTFWQRLWRRSRQEEQLDKELRFHLEQHAADLIAEGVDPAAAHRQARLDIGGPQQVKEECRDARGTRWLDDFFKDLRYTLRTLRQKPGFSAVAIVTLALGIGAVTAIFSAVNPILFEALPYPHPKAIITVWDHLADGQRVHVTFGSYREITHRSRSFDFTAVLKPWQPTMTGAAQPERFEGQRVSAQFFRVLGVMPALGTNFEAADDRPHGPNVTILSDRLWRSHFNADPAIAGRAITLDAAQYTVIGVMPRSFENVLAPSAELWSLLQYDPTVPLDGREWGHHLQMIARLRSGVTLDRAGRELDTIAKARAPDFPRAPWASLKMGLALSPLQEDITRPVKPALLAVIGAVVLLLLIACVNVTNLLLARGAQRRGEFAMRAALGAGRTRLIRQLVTESIVLAGIGGVLGILVAEFGVRALLALSPPELPRLRAIAVGNPVFAFALAITTVIGVIIGLVPAWHASRAGLNAALRDSSRTTIGSHQWTRRTLVVAEVAIALVLLAGSGLLLRSLQRLFSVDAGFNPAHLLTMQVQLSGRGFNGDAAKRRFFDRALDAVRNVPGVASAAFTSQLPLSGDQFGAYGVRFDNGPHAKNDSPNAAFRYAVSPGYIETMGITLRAGRLLNEHDAASAPVAILINESFARRTFGDKDPIGQRIHAGPDEGPTGRIVGVVRDVKQTSLAVGEEDAFYMTSAQGWFADNAMWLVVRSRTDAGELTTAIKRAIWSIDKDQPILRAGSMETLVAASAAERRFALIVFEAFALVALLLAATGIFGLLAGSVTERKREIGVRSALGASRASILGLVMRQAMTLTALGLAIGLAGAFAASRALTSLLYGVSRVDPVTYAGVTFLLILVAALACTVPAWRALRVDPANTLRVE